MTPRDKSAVVQLKARMREPLRARLEAGAKRRGVTLNTELVDRLEQSFAKEDAFEGPEMLNMARLMAAAFIRGGQRGARARKHPEWTLPDWLNDPFCYQAAVQAVVDALAIAQPVIYESTHPDPAMREQHQRLHSVFASVAARGGAVFTDLNPRSLRKRGSTGRAKNKESEE